jgi:RHS repeat-associated protein
LELTRYALATYTYDPDGNTTNTTGTSTDPLKYAGGYQAPAGLYHYGQRYYDPADARWTQQDPLDQTGDLVEGNAYAYAGADPINKIDPLGMRNLTAGGGCFGLGSGVTRDATGKRAGKTRFGGISVGLRSGCSASAIGYTGHADKKTSAHVTVCGGLCLSADTDKGVGFGLGFGVDVSISFG